MVRLKKILRLSDPYPNLGYEIFCYVKAVLGTSFLVFGIFLIFHPLFYKINFFGLLETGLSSTALRILAAGESFLWPKGYWGFFLWGLISGFLGLFFFFQIKLVRKIWGKI